MGNSTGDHHTLSCSHGNSNWLRVAKEDPTHWLAQGIPHTGEEMLEGWCRECTLLSYGHLVQPNSRHRVAEYTQPLWVTGKDYTLFP